jgi:prepilin-type N-terminal cleavage/methylation domain-containing protein
MCLETSLAGSIKAKGFTMVELLVTLVLLGLIASVAAPGLDAWLRARQAAAIRMSLASEMALLPLQAVTQGQALLIGSRQQLQQDMPIQFIKPVSVLANGYCVGGKVSLLQSTQKVEFDILPPFCEVSRSATQ